MRISKKVIGGAWEHNYPTWGEALGEAVGEGVAIGGGIGAGIGATFIPKAGPFIAGPIGYVTERLISPATRYIGRKIGGIGDYMVQLPLRALDTVVPAARGKYVGYDYESEIPPPMPQREASEISRELFEGRRRYYHQPSHNYYIED